MRLKRFSLGTHIQEKLCLVSFQVRNGSVLWNPTSIKQISWDTILTFIDKQHTTLSPLLNVCKRLQTLNNLSFCILKQDKHAKTVLKLGKKTRHNYPGVSIHSMLSSLYLELLNLRHIILTYLLVLPSSNITITRNKEALSCLALYSDVNCIWKFAPQVTFYTFK